MRIAAAPISWGVCEVPGWGRQLDPATVLADMRDVGVTATEFGPAGFLPSDARARSALLSRYQLAAVGGFVPVVLHDRDRDPLAEVRHALDGFGDARMLVLAAATGQPGYDKRPTLDASGWQVLLRNLDLIAGYAAQRGVTATLHPHVGTMVEGADEVRRVLDGAAVRLCLDTGHLLIGGVDPAALTKAAADRIGHVHLKDVDAGLAERTRAGQISYTDAVRGGVYRPLGHGDVDVPGIVATLHGAGYQGWYVLEQDTVLPAAPAHPGAGPGADPGPTDRRPVEDIRASLTYLEQL